jgi:elongation factor 1-beta
MREMQNVRSTVSLREVRVYRTLNSGCKQLARVLASIKIFPKEANIDLNPLKARVQASLPTGSNVQRFDEEPVAFGLVVLIAHVVLPEDAAGHMDQVEEAIRSIDTVSEIQVLRMGRL